LCTPPLAPFLSRARAQEKYAARDVTAEARALARPLPADAAFPLVTPRVPLRESIDASREGDRPGFERVAING
jgi:hypothetical protein